MSDTTFLTALAFAADLVLRIGVAVLILWRSHSTAAVRLAWIIVVLALPFLGIILYALIGEIRMGRAAVVRHRRIAKRVSVLADLEPRLPGDRIAPDGGDPRARALMLAMGSARPSGGNRLELFGDSAAAVERLIEDIDGAVTSCHLLFYIYIDDGTGRRVAAALARAAARGVACRLLVDDVGSRPFLRSDLRRQLHADGVEVAAALPVNPLRALFARLDHRNHRKLVVTDGRVGWTGSQNVADAAFLPKPAFGPWVDVVVRLEGPAVHDLQVIFTQDWLLSRDERAAELLTPRPAPLPGGIRVQVLASGPLLTAPGALRELSLLSFLRTDHELILTTPYFVPDEATTSALCATARAGVHTMLVVPKRNDSPLVARASRSYYERLLEAGVEIYEYTRGLLHAKTFTLDRQIAVVATANLDRRSFELNYEISLVVPNPGFTDQLRQLQLSYVADSEQVDPAAWKRRAWSDRLVENAAGILSPLL